MFINPVMRSVTRNPESEGADPVPVQQLHPAFRLPRDTPTPELMPGKTTLLAILVGACWIDGVVRDLGVRC
jgi:hypothetical protein